MSYEEARCACFWENLPFCTRGLGVATAVVLWGVGVDMVYHHHIIGVYILVFSVTLFFLEITWAITLFLRVCIRNETSRVLGCWSLVLWFDTWKKSVIYWAAAAAVLLRPHTLWLTSVSGGLLIGLGMFHLLLLYRKRLEAKEALLEAKEDSYDRYDDEMDTTVQDAGNTHTDSDTASTHDYILQV
ncbi:transmembrane protein 72 isoform X2 [Procambarus clarkii]|uniref:transmembrane protein 72 isoform X2 n=1 Tax=Procambarus clarkii TaxID=6728 RepID=UPI001E675822|nr:uncharacterized protein LOC123756846 isoform X2 [Procambarus clarkii]